MKASYPNPPVLTLEVRGTPHAVAKWIIRRDKKFNFDRVAHEVKGSVPLSQLRDDELLIAPGLIYRLESE
ncbi:hypothetical protein KW541_10540 [Vibrio fluvialis]|nr:hypothetical protein [Vibrio fluvialis]